MEYHLISPGREQPVIGLYPGNPQHIRGTSTLGDSAVVPHACIEALGHKAVKGFLISLYLLLLRCFVPRPSNFRYESYVPGIAMAKGSDLLIHHGGVWFVPD